MEKLKLYKLIPYGFKYLPKCGKCHQNVRLDTKNKVLLSSMTQNVTLEISPVRHDPFEWKKSFPQIVEKTVEKNTAAPVMYVKKRMGTNEIPCFPLLWITPWNSLENPGQIVEKSVEKTRIETYFHGFGRFSYDKQFYPTTQQRHSSTGTNKYFVNSLQ